MTHGTLTGYTRHGCRCAACTRAMRTYQQKRCPAVSIDRDALSDLLNELFPYGLTDDCPARRSARPEAS